MLFLKQITLLLISPLVISLLLISASFIFKSAENGKAAKRLLISGFLILLVFSQPWVSDVLLYPLEHSREPYKLAEIVESDAIFVPACYYQTRYNLPEISRWHECSLQRLVQAKILSEKLHLPIVVTGGNFLADKTVSYSEKAKSLLEMLGVPSENIISIPNGTTTFSEFEALRNLFNQKRIITITSATHRIRVRMISEQLGMKSKIISVDFQSSGELKPFITTPSILALERVRRAIYEYLAITKHKMMMKIV